jgi:DNA polymerase III subunit epsilon
MTTQVTTLPTLCQQIIANPGKYAVLDTETTDLQGEIIDLAVVGLDGTVLFNELLRPTCKIEEGAMAIHEITEAMVAGARTFKEAWPDISAALGNRIVICYNVEFDRGRFRHTAKVHGIDLPLIDWMCMMLRYAEFYNAPNRYGYGSPAWQRLAYACGQQGVDFEQEHRALGDALAVVALIKRLAELGSEARRYR